MKPYIYVSDGKTYDPLNRKYDILISFEDKEMDDNANEGTIWPEGTYYSNSDFEEYIKSQKPYGIRIKIDTQEELEYLIEQIHGFAVSLDLIAKHNRSFDLTPLERCSKLETIQLYWNIKQEKLWDMKRNTKLKYFEMTDYYKVSDCSAFCGSSIEVLKLFGCNSLSSFVSKMHIDDLSFILEMPNLRELYLDIVKDKNSEYYLNLFAKCTHLHILSNPDNFFTFQQFAWLNAHLPNVECGLECVCDCGDFYSIIGRRTPKYLVDIKKTEKYQIRYDALIEKYKTRENPPSDDEKE